MTVHAAAADAPRPPGPPLVSCIVPLYNALELTRAMLDSFLATVPEGLNWELIFVDDGSTDGTRDWLASLADPRIRAILNDRNLGYAGANNRGAAEARGRHLVLLNNDLVLRPGWLQPLLRAVERRFARAGVIGNVQLRVDDGSVDHAGIVVGADTKLSHLHTPPEGRVGRAVRVFAVTAACCLVRADVFRRAGGFDTAFENGGEDVDLCLKLRSLGYRTYLAPDSVVLHHVSATRGQVSLRDERNSRRLFAKWGIPLSLAAADAFLRQVPPEDLGAIERAARALRSRGLPMPVPRRYRLLARSAVWREESRWREIFGELHPYANAPAEEHAAEGFRHDGQTFLDVSPGAHWGRETHYPWIDRFATLRFPAGYPYRNLIVFGLVKEADPAKSHTEGDLGLRVTINGIQTVERFPLEPGPFRMDVSAPAALPDRPTVVRIELLGVERTNRLGLIGRLTSGLPLSKAWHERHAAYRLRPLNRRLRFTHLVADDERILEFKHPKPQLPLKQRLRGVRAGINVVGWLRAELGIGESARCMARACDAIGLPAALIEMRLPCLNRSGDETFADRLQDANPHPANVFHIDPPVARDIDHHHGAAFRAGKLNVGYWAWELPQFPDEWVPQADFFDEIWCPSEFVRDAVAAKVDIPVIVMPHAIQMPAPGADPRGRFGLPRDRFLFLFLYDLNSYQERKNPLAVIEAYRRAFPDEQGVGLIIKTQNPQRNAAAYSKLEDAIAGLRHASLIARTLPRNDVYALEAACDSFVSLHRSEGFGLAVAESMALGKPVISTDWSATTEFVNAGNGCPVRATTVRLTEDHGPYRKGSTWADPDVDDAAGHMVRLAADREYGRRLGAQAAADIRERLSPAAVGSRYIRRLAELGLRIG